VSIPERRHVFAQQIGGYVGSVEIFAEGGRPVSIVMTQATPEAGRIPSDLAQLARALGLGREDLATERLPAQVLSTEDAHLLVPITDRDAVDRVQPIAEDLFATLRSLDCEGCYVFSLDPRCEAADVYARFFNPADGLWEDPASGGAAGPLAYHLREHGLAPTGRVLVEQGTAMGRMSLIEARVTNADVTVSGSAVTVAEGVLKL
jgi:trans-2,3-dihydro-3-hydroxyanthranilate isomerase